MNDDASRTRDAIKTASELDDFGPIGLQYLADAPILNPNSLFLPCGKLSKQESERRERENWKVER